MLQSQLCYYWGELWKQFLPKGPIKVLATVDISLHIGIYLSVYTRNFNVPFSNLECRVLFFLIFQIVSFGYDDFTCISNPGGPASRDFYCVIHVSVLKATNFIKALLLGLQ